MIWYSGNCQVLLFNKPVSPSKPTSQLVVFRFYRENLLKIENQGYFTVSFTFINRNFKQLQKHSAMTTLKEKEVHSGTPTLKAKNIVEKLYELRKAFEADYSGALRSLKYEATRDFTINLNHAIFEANQMALGTDKSDSETALLETKLNLLRLELKSLIR